MAKTSFNTDAARETCRTLFQNGSFNFEEYAIILGAVTEELDGQNVHVDFLHLLIEHYSVQLMKRCGPDRVVPTYRADFKL